MFRLFWKSVVRRGRMSKTSVTTLMSSSVKLMPTRMSPQKLTSIQVGGVTFFLFYIPSRPDSPECLPHIPDEQFIVVTMDLFLAGSETTSNTIEFAMLYLIQHPEVQRKVQAEIDAVVGRNRLPCISDKPLYDMQVFTFILIIQSGDFVLVGCLTRRQRFWKSNGRLYYTLYQLI